MFDHVKCLKDRFTFAYYVYDSKYCKILIIVCCDMQSEDGTIQTLFWKKLNYVMAENGVSNVNFKGFMTDGTHAKWIAVIKIYGEGDQTLLMMGPKRTCLFHWSQSLDKVAQKYIKASL